MILKFGEVILLIKVIIMAYIVLIPSFAILITMFVKGMIALHKQEKEYGSSIGKDGYLLYMEKAFGIGKFEIFNSIYDEVEGKFRYTVFSPHYEWFKTPKYTWYEVSATENGYQHNVIEK
jgi:hypothetical protein